MTTLTHLECSRCRKNFDPADVRGSCDCGGALLARYDLEATRLSWSREWLGHAPSTMWRYAPLLPVANPNSIVSLGEGMTPLLRARHLGDSLGLKDLWVKDEGVNPAATVEARGCSCAISIAVERGLCEAGAGPAGDPASALAAYAAAAGIQGRAGGDEAYYLEGIKTVGLEIAEQFRWELPDVILAPAGSIIVGLQKAFDELEAIGWIPSKRPRLVAVEPAALPEMLEAGLEMARAEGIFPAPEAGACLMALGSLALSPDDRIVLVNPASGLRYAAAYATRLPRAALTEQDKLGGLITPR